MIAVSPTRHGAVPKFGSDQQSGGTNSTPSGEAWSPCGSGIAGFCWVEELEMDPLVGDVQGAQPDGQHPHEPLRSALHPGSRSCPARQDRCEPHPAATSGATVRAVGVGLETVDSGVAGPTTTDPSVGPTTVARAGPMRQPVAQPGCPRPHHGQAGSQARPRRRIRPARSRALRPPSPRRPRDRGHPPRHHRPQPRPTRQRALPLDRRLSRRLEPLRPAHPQAPTLPGVCGT
jgi:hypothetical protein